MDVLLYHVEISATVTKQATHVFAKWVLHSMKAHVLVTITLYTLHNTRKTSEVRRCTDAYQFPYQMLFMAPVG